MLDKELKSEIKAMAGRVDEVLAEVFAEHGNIHGRMLEAMRYTMEGKGKRLRAAMVLMCAEAVADEADEKWRGYAEAAAAAIEMVHTYSLVHDDLPAMDNDDMRRGKASCHKKFDEATAILAGDALLTFAFEVIVEKIKNATIAAKVVGILAGAAGPAGMIAGQAADLAAEGKAGTLEELEYIHLNKTAKMFEGACLMGGACGDANRKAMNVLSRFGLKVGLAFQVADDILDIEQSSEVLGKTAGKDAAQGKLTYPALIGLEKSKALLSQLTSEAVAILDPLSGRAKKLRLLAKMMNKREK